jgi:hypothetical protein
MIIVFASMIFPRKSLTRNLIHCSWIIVVLLIYVFVFDRFNERGRIFTKQETRAIGTGPAGIFFTGDGSGELKVWKFSP